MDLQSDDPRAIAERRDVERHLNSLPELDREILFAMFRSGRRCEAYLTQTALARKTGLSLYAIRRRGHELLEALRLRFGDEPAELASDNRTPKVQS